MILSRNKLKKIKKTKNQSRRNVRKRKNRRKHKKVTFRKRGTTNLRKKTLKKHPKQRKYRMKGGLKGTLEEERIRRASLKQSIAKKERDIKKINRKIKNTVGKKNKDKLKTKQSALVLQKQEMMKKLLDEYEKI